MEISCSEENGMRAEPIRIGEREIPVRVIKKRIRNSYARVKNGEVVIELPASLGSRSSAKTVLSLRNRISKAILSNPGRYLMDGQLKFADGQLTRPLGMEFRICISRVARSTCSARVSGNIITAHIPESASQPASEELISKAISKALSQASAPMLGEIVEKINSSGPKSEVRRLIVKPSRRVWGYYSIKDGSLMLNTKLLYAPYPILEYVIIHELVHAKIRSHSRRFWDLVRSFLPDYKERRRWLRENSFTITS